MADLSDAEAALVAIVVTALGIPPSYQNGAVAKTASGHLVKAYPGWPNANDMDADLAAWPPIAHISVFQISGMAVNTSPYPRRWQRQRTRVQPTLTWNVDGDVATLGGTIPAPQNVALILDGADFVYPAQPTDTPATVIAALAALLTAADRWTVSVNGASLTAGGARSIVARVGAIQPVIKEVRRQQQGFRVSFWCPDPETRTALASVADAYMAATNFLTLADGTAARMRYRSTTVDDVPQKDHEWRRDLMVMVEYATTQTATVPQAVVVRTGIQAGASAPVFTIEL